ncbi:hypothetical protein VTK73DRAFT_401 [Phialemonium thermophilum]|uniref:RCC1-like domain-containing protein n=1 Tax=Phialemonium thermophilum TaxID=223376 RepID=A0ABR3XEJ8_9PEZI
MAMIFALGSNGSGQLGIGHKEDVSVPKQVKFAEGGPPDSIRSFAAGGNHTILLSGSGDLFWSGDASTGACGRVSASQSVEVDTALTIPQFRRVQLDEPQEGGPPFRAGLVTATWEATIVTRVSHEGKNTRVYSFGVGLKGELGQGQFIIRSPSPSLIPDFPPAGTEIVDLASGMNHCVAVLNNGDVYGWGNGRKGQLGKSATSEAAVHSPMKIDDVDFPVSRAVCGREFTLLVGDLRSGRVLFLGSDKWGIRSALPTTSPGWKDVAAGWSNIYALSPDGKLQSWGRNDHGQMVPPNLPPIAQVAAGSEHVLALDEAGSVLTWGWGEHGNCGPQVENNDVKGRWNVIASKQFMPPGAEITDIGAGCATSWIVMSIPS